MKKIVCIFVAVLMIASVVYAQKKMAITAKDLAGMKGMWSGSIDFGLQAEIGSSACTLEILNDKVPIEAKLTISMVTDAAASMYGLQKGSNTFEILEGILTSKGTIFFTGPEKNFLEITKTGDKKVSLYYCFKGLRETALSRKNRNLRQV